MSTTITRLRSQLQDLIDSGEVALRLPIESGRSQTHGRAGWVQVSFSKPFGISPSVVVTGELKTQKLKQYKVDLPSVEIPQITIPEIEIPRIVVPDVEIPLLPFKIPRIKLVELISGYETISEYMAKEMSDSFLDSTEWWQIVPILAQIRSAISGVVYIIGYFMGGFFDWFSNSYIQPSIDHIQNVIKELKDKVDFELIGDPAAPQVDSMNYVFDQMETKLQDALDELVVGMNLSLKSIGDEVQTSFDTVKNTVNRGTKAIELGIEDAINNQITRLFEYLGVFDGAPFVPVKVKSVTRNSFEYYSTGAGTYHWIAVSL